MKYQTTIDTVSIQIDLRENNAKDEMLQDILSLLIGNNIYITYNDHQINAIHSNFTRREYKAVANNLVLASIKEGSYSYKYINASTTVYYVAIEFAGLMRYNKQLDKLANDTLFLVCAYLNTRHITFKITGLDIALDLFTDYGKVLALCTKKAPKTTYYAANEKQTFSTTTYIEKIPQGKQEKVVQKAYLYDKTVKENLSYKLTRFEVKLQSSFFTTKRVNLWSSIMNTLSKYHVMYIPNAKEKRKLMDDYDACHILRSRDIKRIGFDNYRCYHDMASITGFINKLYTVKGI